MKRLIILVALIFMTSAQADIDIKGYKLGMTLEQFQNHAEDETLTQYLELKEPFEPYPHSAVHWAVDHVWTTINKEPVILTARFNKKGRVDWINVRWGHITESSIHDKVCDWQWQNDPNFIYGPKCGIKRNTQSVIEHDTLVKSLQKKFKRIEITADSWESSNGNMVELTRFVYVEAGVRLIGYTKESDNKFDITILKQSQYLKNKKYIEDLRAKTLDDI